MPLMIKSNQNVTRGADSIEVHNLRRPLDRLAMTLTLTFVSTDSENPPVCLLLAFR